MDTLERVPPHDLAAEEGLLGSMLLSQDVALRFATAVRADEFYGIANRTVFEAMLALLGAGQPVNDPVLLRDRVARAGVPDASVKLRDVLDGFYLPSNAEHYARAVQECAQLRRVIEAGIGMARAAYDRAQETPEILDYAGRVFMEAVERNVSENESVSLDDAAAVVCARAESGEARAGVKTGLVDLDGETNGMRNGEMIVLAARPGMGKSSLATQIVRHVALSGAPVGVFSLEVSREDFTTNLLCQHGKVDSRRVRSGRLDQGEKDRLRGARMSMGQGARIEIDDTSALTAMALRAKARLMKRRHKVGFIVLDYVQLMAGAGRKGENREQEVAGVSRAVKQLARELDVPILALAQLSRAVEAREGHKPRLSDLRESGSLEQDADQVWLLYREAYYKPEKAEIANQAEVIIAKNRNGGTGSVELHFMREFTRFENAAMRGAR